SELGVASLLGGRGRPHRLRQVVEEREVLPPAAVDGAGVGPVRTEGAVHRLDLRARRVDLGMVIGHLALPAILSSGTRTKRAVVCRRAGDGTSRRAMRQWGCA